MLFEQNVASNVTRNKELKHVKLLRDERIIKVDHYYQVLTQNIFRSYRTLSIEQFASN